MTEIVIRHAVPDDYLALHGIKTQPKAAAGTLQLPWQSPEVFRKRLTEPSPDVYTLVALIDGVVVGEASLHVLSRPRRRHVGQIGMAVHDDWQGQGVGTALMGALLELADDWINLHRIELDVYTDNAPAIALYQKFGFAIEGTLRDYAFRSGRYVDTYVMGRIKSAPSSPLEA